VQPIFQINMALAALLTPIFVRTYQTQGREALDSKLKRYLGRITFITGGYFLFLTLFGQPLISWLYGGKYDADVSLGYMMLLGLIPIVTTVSRAFDAALNAMGKIRLSFQSKLIPTLLTIILDVILMTALGAIGFLIESLLTSSLTLARLAMFYRQQRTPPPPAGLTQDDLPTQPYP
jgi:O-antigen/teichoic acid export membrane protein